MKTYKHETTVEIKGKDDSIVKALKEAFNKTEAKLQASLPYTKGGSIRFEFDVTVPTLEHSEFADEHVKSGVELDALDRWVNGLVIAPIVKEGITEFVKDRELPEDVTGILAMIPVIQKYVQENLNESPILKEFGKPGRFSPRTAAINDLVALNNAPVPETPEEMAEAFAKMKEMVAKLAGVVNKAA